MKITRFFTFKGCGYELVFLFVIAKSWNNGVIIKLIFNQSQIRRGKGKYASGELRNSLVRNIGAAYGNIGYSEASKVDTGGIVPKNIQLESGKHHKCLPIDFKIACLNKLQRWRLNILCGIHIRLRYTKIHVPMEIYVDDEAKLTPHGFVHVTFESFLIPFDRSRKCLGHVAETRSCSGVIIKPIFNQSQIRCEKGKYASGELRNSLRNIGAAYRNIGYSEASKLDTGGIVPEYIQLESGNQKDDIYAFGVLLLELLNGKKSSYRFQNCMLE
nr:protein STRUBBELIG-receptor family 2 [Tanacetum cinerariifolium]